MNTRPRAVPGPPRPRVRRSRSVGVPVRYLVGTLVVSTLSLAIAASVLWPVYQSAAFVRAVVGALVVGQVVALAGARWRLGPWVVSGLCLAAVGLVGVPLAVPSSSLAGVLPTGQGLVALAEGSVLSWKRLLTIATPVGDYQALLVPALLLVVAATVSTTSIALRARVPDLATIVPVLLLGAGIALGPRDGWFPILTGAALTLVLLVWLTALRERRTAATSAAAAEGAGSVSFTRGERRRSLLSSVAAAAVMVLIAVALGGAATSAVPPRADRAVARDAVDRPFIPRDDVSPLSTFRSFHATGSADSIVLTADGLESSRIRLAVMDDFDGAVWRVGTADDPSAAGSFERLPFRLDPSVDGTESVVSVTIGSYEGIWMPGTGYLGEVDFGGDRASVLADSLYYNAVAGASAVTAGLRSGDTYTVSAVDPVDSTIGGVADLVPARTPERPARTPDGFVDLVDRYTTAGAAPGENLAAVLEGIATVGYISHGVGEDEPTSPSGHGLDRLSRLLSDVPMVGDGEQYASLAALVARHLGFPSRVVMGFASDAAAGSGPTAFTGSDVSAWIEVEVAGRGWVAVDPTPEERPVPAEQPEDPTLIARPYPDLQPPVDEEPDRSEQSAPDSSEPEDEPVVDPFVVVLLQVLRVAAWLVIVLAVVLSPFVAVAAAKARRRSLRRRTRDPDERVAAGWREFSDAVVDFGIEPPASSTRHELATLHGSRGAHRLAVLADRVSFSPLTTSEEDAARAWRLVDDLRRALGSRVDRRGRLLAAVSLRSLGLRRRRSRPARRAPRTRPAGRRASGER